MNETKLKVSGVIFLVIGVLHLVRFFAHWQIVVAGNQVPLGISVPAGLIFLALGTWLLKPLCCK